MLSEFDEYASIGEEGPQHPLCAASVALRGSFTLCVLRVVTFGERDFVVYRPKYCSL